MKLMIVDDSLIVRNAVERHARAIEISEVFSAQDGSEALAIFDEQQPDLVTMDLTMPNLDGLGCLQELQKRGRPVSIMVISAINSHQTAMDAIAAGACGFLTKPFTARELEEALTDLIQHREEHGSHL